MILSRRFLFLKLAEYWFDEKAYAASNSPVALLRTTIPQNDFLIAIPEKTIHINLSLSKEDLYHNLSARAKHSITNSEKTAKIVLADSEILRQEFYNNYSSFAIAHKLLVPNRAEELDHDIFMARDPVNNTILHAAMFMPCISAGVYRYRYSVSLAKSQANAAILWQAMLHAKKQGFRYFDLGGIPRSEKTSRKLASILFFKSQFGGQPIDSFLYIKTKNPILQLMFRLLKPMISSERFYALIIPIINRLSKK